MAKPKVKPIKTLAEEYREIQKKREPKKPTRTKEATAKAKGPARSYTYTQEIADEICKRLADGESLNSICKTPEIPSRSTVIAWSTDATHEFAAKYARAREIGWTNVADEMLEIADNSELDHNDRRIRLDTRKWMLSKMLPKVYGDKVQHSGEGGGPLKIHMIPGDAAL